MASAADEERRLRNEDHARIAEILAEMRDALGHEFTDDVLVCIGRIAEIVRHGDRTDYRRVIKTVDGFETVGGASDA